MEKAVKEKNVKLKVKRDFYDKTDSIISLDFRRLLCYHYTRSVRNHPDLARIKSQADTIV